MLTARRSMAVDRAFIAMSTPIFVETNAPVVGKPGTTAPWQHLLIAQDTGAGIIGAVRGDIYWGDDATPPSSAAGWAAPALLGAAAQGRHEVDCRGDLVDGCTRSPSR